MTREFENILPTYVIIRLALKQLEMNIQNRIGGCVSVLQPSGLIAVFTGKVYLNLSVLQPSSYDAVITGKVYLNLLVLQSSGLIDVFTGKVYLNLTVLQPSGRDAANTV